MHIRNAHTTWAHWHRELGRYELLVAVDARLPVANFGYRSVGSASIP